jgi:hypothetical protein
MTTRWFIFVPGRGFFVSANEMFTKALFDPNSHYGAKGFVSKGNAEDIAHKLWLAGYGDYKLKEMEVMAKNKDKPTASDYAITEYMESLVKKVGATHIQLTYRPGGNSNRLWEITVVDKNVFFKTRIGRTPQQVHDEIVEAMTGNG